MEIKAERKRGGQRLLVVVVVCHYQKRWWSSRVRPWLRRERESEIAERGSETDLVVEGYKSRGCGGGGVFVSWIEA